MALVSLLASLSTSGFDLSDGCGGGGTFAIDLPTSGGDSVTIGTIAANTRGASVRIAVSGQCEDHASTPPTSLARFSCSSIPSSRSRPIVMPAISPPPVLPGEEAIPGRWACSEVLQNQIHYRCYYVPVVIRDHAYFHRPADLLGAALPPFALHCPYSGRRYLFLQKPAQCDGFPGIVRGKSSAISPFPRATREGGKESRCRRTASREDHSSIRLYNRRASSPLPSLQTHARTPSFTPRTNIHEPIPIKSSTKVC